jgi:hypothetical protein
MDVTSALVALPTEEAIYVLVKASIALMSVRPPWESQAPVNKFTLAGLTAVLSFEDSACVLTVRKVHRLGSRSVEIIRTEFGKLAAVDKVLLLPGRLRVEGPPKLASMAFVVMNSPDDAKTVLASAESFARSLNILVQSFHLPTLRDSKH